MRTDPKLRDTACSSTAASMKKPVSRQARLATKSTSRTQARKSGAVVAAIPPLKAGKKTKKDRVVVPSKPIKRSVKKSRKSASRLALPSKVLGTLDQVLRKPSAMTQQSATHAHPAHSSSPECEHSKHRAIHEDAKSVHEDADDDGSVVREVAQRASQFIQALSPARERTFWALRQLAQGLESSDRAVRRVSSKRARNAEDSDKNDNSSSGSSTGYSSSEPSWITESDDDDEESEDERACTLHINRDGNDASRAMRTVKHERGDQGGSLFHGDDEIWSD